MTPIITELDALREKATEEILLAWANGYRTGPVEYRFPSDPHAEFFPADMERAAREITALREQIVKMREALVEAELQIDYLHKKFQPTGTGEATLSRIRAALTSTAQAVTKEGK